jgi:HAMP domain-containing protein
LDILLSTLTKHILEIKVGLGGYAFLVDSSGRPIAIPNDGIADFVWNDTHKDALQELLKPLDKQVWTENLKDAMEISLCENPNEKISKIIERMCEQERGIEEILLSDEKKIAAYAPIPSTKWSICIVIPIEEVVSPAKETEGTIKSGINSIIDSFTIGTTIVLATSILIGAILGYYITKPIANLTKVTKEISLGNLDLQVEVKSKDEIGELSENFNRMLNSIKITISELEKGVENTQNKNNEQQLPQLEQNTK